MGQRVVRSGLFLLGPGVIKGAESSTFAVSSSGSSWGMPTGKLTVVSPVWKEMWTLYFRFNTILFQIQWFPLKKIRLKMLPANWQQLCLHTPCLGAMNQQILQHRLWSSPCLRRRKQMITSQPIRTLTLNRRMWYFQEKTPHRKLNQQFDPIESNWFRAIRFTLVGTGKQLKSNLKK